MYNFIRKKNIDDCNKCKTDTFFKNNYHRLHNIV